MEATQSSFGYPFSNTDLNVSTSKEGDLKINNESNRQCWGINEKPKKEIESLKNYFKNTFNSEDFEKDKDGRTVVYEEISKAYNRACGRHDQVEEDTSHKIRLETIASLNNPLNPEECQGFREAIGKENLDLLLKYAPNPKFRTICDMVGEQYDWRWPITITEKVTERILEAKNNGNLNDLIEKDLIGSFIKVVSPCSSEALKSLSGPENSGATTYIDEMREQLEKLDTALKDNGYSTSINTLIEKSIDSRNENFTSLISLLHEIDSKKVEEALGISITKALDDGQPIKVNQLLELAYDAKSASSFLRAEVKTRILRSLPKESDKNGSVINETNVDNDKQRKIHEFLLDGMELKKILTLNNPNMIKSLWEEATKNGTTGTFMADLLKQKISFGELKKIVNAIGTEPFFEEAGKHFLSCDKDILLDTLHNHKELASMKGANFYKSNGKKGTELLNAMTCYTYDLKNKKWRANPRSEEEKSAIEFLVKNCKINVLDTKSCKLPAALIIAHVDSKNKPEIDTYLVTKETEFNANRPFGPLGHTLSKHGAHRSLTDLVLTNKTDTKFYSGYTHLVGIAMGQQLIMENRGSEDSMTGRFSTTHVHDNVKMGVGITATESEKAQGGKALFFDTNEVTMVFDQPTDMWPFTGYPSHVNPTIKTKTLIKYV